MTASNVDYVELLRKVAGFKDFEEARQSYLNLYDTIFVKTYSAPIESIIYTIAKIRKLGKYKTWDEAAEEYKNLALFCIDKEWDITKILTEVVTLQETDKSVSKWSEALESWKELNQHMTGGMKPAKITYSIEQTGIVKSFTQPEKQKLIKVDPRGIELKNTRAALADQIKKAAQRGVPQEILTKINMILFDCNQLLASGIQLNLDQSHLIKQVWSNYLPEILSVHMNVPKERWVSDKTTERVNGLLDTIVKQVELVENDVYTKENDKLRIQELFFKDKFGTQNSESEPTK